MFFGIPLSIGAIVTGVALGLGTKWVVFRYPWVVAKLLLIVSVMVVGGAIIGPAEKAMLEGHVEAVSRLIAAASLWRARAAARDRIVRVQAGPQIPFNSGVNLSADSEKP